MVCAQRAIAPPPSSPFTCLFPNSEQPRRVQTLQCCPFVAENGFDQRYYKVKQIRRVYATIAQMWSFIMLTCAALKSHGGSKGQWQFGWGHVGDSHPNLTELFRLYMKFATSVPTLPRSVFEDLLQPDYVRAKLLPFTWSDGFNCNTMQCWKCSFIQIL